MADSHFARDGAFHPRPDFPLKPLAEPFCAQILKLLVNLRLLPPERVQVFRSHEQKVISCQFHLTRRNGSFSIGLLGLLGLGWAGLGF